MSTGLRLPLAPARTEAEKLMDALGLRAPAAMIVGSIRREKSDVGDIEIIAPMPYNDRGALVEDTLYHAIRRLFWKPAPTPKGGAMLFAAETPTANVLGRVIQGHNPAFKQCDLELWIDTRPPNGNPALAALAGGETHLACKVNIFRYMPGPLTNRGWIEVLRTGSAEFGHKGVLSCWKFVCGTLGDDRDGSKEGFLCDSLGNLRNTPNEHTVFQMIGCLFVPPHLRTGPEVLCRVKTPFNIEKRTAAMELLGIRDDEEVAARWISEGAIARRPA